MDAIDQVYHCRNFKSSVKKIRDSMRYLDFFTISDGFNFKLSKKNNNKSFMKIHNWYFHSSNPFNSEAIQIGSNTIGFNSELGICEYNHEPINIKQSGTFISGNLVSISEIFS